MSTTIELIAREGAFLAALLALGAAPASLLSERFDAAARLAIAPLLGFCLGTCLLATVLEFFPAGDTFWLLPLLGAASVAFAVVRTRRRGFARPALNDLAQILVVVALVAGPLTFTLIERGTVGPVAYTYTDVDGFVAEEDGAIRASTRDARAMWEQFAATGEPMADLTLQNWAFNAWFSQNIDAVPIKAHMTRTLGLGATETFSPFLIVLLLIGALSAYAAVRYFTRSATWLAVLAGALFGGPFYLELWFDSYQAATISTGLVVPVAVVLVETLRGGRWEDVGLLALLLGTFTICYPVFVPVVFLAAGLVGLAAAVAAGRRGVNVRALARPALARLALLAGVMLVLAPVGITRNFHFYRRLLSGEVSVPRVPWPLPLDVIPSWLLQTRGLWALTPPGESLKAFVIGALVPLAMLGFVVVGIRRYRPALVLVVLGLLSALIAWYSFASEDACTYCAERGLLPLAPIGFVLLALGLHTFVSARPAWARMLGVAGVLLVVVFVGQRARIELARFLNNSYFLDSSARTVLDKLPEGAGPVHIEGFGQTFQAQAEQPLVYHLVNERVPGRVSISLAAPIYNATQYLDYGGRQAPDVEFRTGYTHVLTRFAGLKTARARVARDGAFALDVRARPLDVTPYSGLLAPMGRLDRSGVPRLHAGVPLRMYVAGETDGPAFVHLTFRATAPFDIPQQAGVSSRRDGELALVCVPVTGAGPVREATLNSNAALVPAPFPSGLYPPPQPPLGVTLIEMTAVEGKCEP